MKKKLKKQLAELQKQNQQLLQEITAYKKNEEALKQSNIFLRAISRAQSQYIIKADIRELFDDLLTKLLNLTNSQYGFIGRILYTADQQPYLKTYAITNIAWNDETKQLYDKYAAEGMEFHNLNNLFGAVMTTFEPVIANNPVTDPRRGGLPPGHPPLNAFLGLPILSDKKLIGMAGVANCPDGYNQDMIKFLQPFLTTCSAIIKAYTQETEHKQTQQALQQSQAMFTQLYESALDAIIVVDSKGCIERVNAQVQTLFGYSQAELLNKPIELLVPERFQAKHKQLCQDYQANPKTRAMHHGLELYGQHKNGSQIALNIMLSAIELDNQQKVLCVIRDIAKQKKTHTILQESEKHYRTLVEGSHAIVQSVEPSGRFLFVNQTWYTVLGYSKLELTQLNLWNIVHPDSLDYCLAIFSEVMGGHAIDSIQLKVIAKNGEQVVLAGSAVGEYVDGKLISINSFFRDITKRIKAETKALQAEERYRALFEDAPVMYVITRNQQGLPIIADCNQMFLNRLGYTRTEVLEKPLGDFYSPQSRIALLEKGGYLRALTDKFSIEERQLIAKEGRIINTLLQTNPEYDVDGNITGSRATYIDISKLRQTEETLIIRDRAIAAASNGIIITDPNQPDNPAIYVNPAFETITGYTQQEALGHNCRFLHRTDKNQAALAELRNAVKNGRKCKVVIRNYKKDGTLFFNELTVSPIYNNKNKLTHFIGIQRDITHQKQIELELREINERFTHFMERFPGSAFIDDADGHLVYCNKYFASQFSPKSKQTAALVGKPLAEILPPDLLAKIKIENAQVLHNNQDLQAEHIVMTPQGLTHWLVIKFPIKQQNRLPLVGGISLNITALKELEKETQLLYDISRGLNSAITYNDIAMALANPAKQFGASRVVLICFDLNYQGEPTEAEIVSNIQLEDKPFLPVETRFNIKDSPYRDLGWDQDPKTLHLFSNLLTETKLSEETRSRMSNNGLDHAVALLPLFHNDHWVGFIIFTWSAPHQFQSQEIRIYQALLDLVAPVMQSQHLIQTLETERKLLSTRIEERTAELSRINAELARVNRLKDEFLASMSHELRTPLNAILGKSEAMQEGIHGPLTEKQTASLRTIEDSGRHLLALINDILDLSKIEAGKMKTDISSVPVNSVCQASLQMIKELAHKKQIQITTKFDSNVTYLQTDIRHLKQILVNLLSNAVKFTPSGREIGLEVSGDKTHKIIYFTVWDTGIGIAQKDRDRLFNPFTQLDSSLAREYAGTGLGLSLVARLVEIHNGNLALESEVEKGSRFTISLPWLQENIDVNLANNKTIEHAQATYAYKETSPSNHTILLVEDNEINIDLFSGYLSSKGYNILIARNGFEAIDQAQKNHPDLILMDIQMPDMDGLEAIRRIRSSKDPQLITVPIIALTALAMPGDCQECLAAGANDYKSKPVSLKSLVKSIKTYLN